VTRYDVADFTTCPKCGGQLYAQWNADAGRMEYGHVGACKPKKES
jgi:hypothetical protein